MPKFDIIIGNPPYEGKYTPLYLQLLDKLIPFAKEISWLCPAQWVKSYHYTDGASKIKNKISKSLVSYEFLEQNPFDDASFANQLGVFLFKENKNSCNVNEIFYEKFSNKNLAKSIEKKFKTYKDNVNNHSDRTNKSVLPGYWCNIGRIRGNVRKSKPCWDWTTLFSAQNKTDFKYRIGTHANHIKFDTVNECKNFIKYTETDIIGFSIFITKDNNNNTPPMLAAIPWLGDYTHEWAEAEIAKEIGLTQEEVDYIHEEMKDFGWKTRNKDA